MKKITFLLSIILITFSSFSQKTHEINLSARADTNLNWQMGIGTNNDATIAIGDTVIWTWTDTFTHTVRHTGGAEPFFDSGPINGLGMTYQHTFTVVGITTYDCGFHPATMQGTINVIPLSVEDEKQAKLKMYPNPVTDNLFIKAPIEISKITITSILGKKILEKKAISSSLNIDMSAFRSGMYFIQIESGDKINTYRVIKK